MQEKHKFGLISLVSGIVCGMAVAMTLPSLTQDHMGVDHAVSVSKTVDDTAASRVAARNVATPTSAPPARRQEQGAQAVAARNVATPTSAPPADLPMRPSHTLAKVNRTQLRQHQAQLQQLEQRLNQLVNPSSSPNGAAEDIQTQAVQRAEVTPEEAIAADLSQWEETQMRFEREEVDRTWATATQQLFESDIAGSSEGSGFSIMSTACRSTQCAAVLEWPSYSEAVQGYGTLLHHPYQANCARHTLLPPPNAADADQPYQMTIIFDCSEWREQG